VFRCWSSKRSTGLTSLTVHGRSSKLVSTTREATIYWLGNDLLHQLTINDRYKLRFDLQALDGIWYYAEYSRFTVSSKASNYTMQVSGYSGNAGDSLSHHNGMMFTTYDRDNDQFRRNCALEFGGGFWYKACGYCGVMYANSGASQFMWAVSRSYTISILTLQSTRMWLTC